MTIFYDAVVHGNFEEIQKCIDNQLDVNAPTETPDGSYDYPLNLAVNKNSTKIAQQLLQYGAWTNMKDNLNHTPMEYAEENKNITLIKLLKKYACQINPNLSCGDLFLDAVTTGDASTVEALYNQFSRNKAVMMKASKKLIETILYDTDNVAFESKWHPIAKLFTHNPYYENYLFLELYNYSMYPEKSWLKIGITAHLYCKGYFELINSFLDQRSDLDNYPSIVIDGTSFLNVLQMAIIFYSNPQALPFIKNLLKEYGMSKIFSKSPAALTIEIYTEKEFKKLSLAVPDGSTSASFMKWININNPLELAIASFTKDKSELVEFLADNASDLDLIISTARCLNNESMNSRLVPLGNPTTTSEAFLHKTECDERTIEIMNSFTPSSGITLTKEKNERNIHQGILSTIDEVNQSKRTPSPMKATYLFYSHSQNSHQLSNDEAHLRMAQSLLEKLNHRMSLLDDTTLRLYFSQLIEMGNAKNKEESNDSLKEATNLFLAAEMIYTIIKNPNLSDLEKMLQSYLFKTNALKKMLGQSHQQVFLQYLTAGQLLNYSFKYQWENTLIQSFIQKSMIYQMLMQKIERIGLGNEASFFSKSGKANSQVTPNLPKIVKMPESGNTGIFSGKKSKESSQSTSTSAGLPNQI